MNHNDIMVIDFETGSVDPHTTIPLQLAAKVYNCRSLQAYESKDAEFESYMRPLENEYPLIQEAALKVNKIDVELHLKTAPPRSEVWKRFVTFVSNWNPGGKVWTAPVVAGHNIREFDLVIVNRLIKESKCGELFYPRDKLDLKDILFPWFENSDFLPNYKLDTLRDKFGIAKDGAHRALNDVIVTGDLIMRFLRLHRQLYPRIGFKNA